jgi:hypothetical protein
MSNVPNEVVRTWSRNDSIRLVCLPWKINLLIGLPTCCETIGLILSLLGVSMSGHNRVKSNFHIVSVRRWRLYCRQLYFKNKNLHLFVISAGDLCPKPKLVALWYNVEGKSYETLSFRGALEPAAPLNRYDFGKLNFYLDVDVMAMSYYVHSAPWYFGCILFDIVIKERTVLN